MPCLPTQDERTLKNPWPRKKLTKQERAIFPSFLLSLQALTCLSFVPCSGWPSCLSCGQRGPWVCGTCDSPQQPLDSCGPRGPCSGNCCPPFLSSKVASIRSQHSCLLGKQTVKTFQCQEAWSLAAGQGTWQPLPRDRRKDYPFGHYLGPTGFPPCIHKRCQGKDIGKGGAGDYFFLPLVWRSGVLARGYSGKLDDVIDQIGVWGLSMDFIYLCFPWSLLL